MENPNQKKSLCRYYLRGLCVLSREECQFAHGIKDLHYSPLAEGEEVEYDYLKETDFTQKITIKGPRVYINLYQYQNPKKYTLEQLNLEGPLRRQVRNKMHKQMFPEFMNLLEQTYPETHLTQSFLLREYTRVGFNKLMTRIKFSHLTDALCQGSEPKYFIKSLVMPPLVSQSQNFIFRRASEEQIIQQYREECSRLLKQSEQPQESVLKKQLFQTTFDNPHIPPLNLILKEKKTNFTDFLRFINEGEETLMIEKIRLDPTVEEIKEIAQKYLKESSQKVVSWTDLFSFLSKQLKLNNGNILNQVRPLLVLEGYYFFYMPMVQFIIKQDHQYNFKAESLHICQCQMKEPFDLSPYDEEISKKKKQMQFEESVDINDWESLMTYAGNILDSKIAAIDLEGRLRKGGYVEMVQLNNSTNTFLFDIFLLTKNKDQKTIDLIKKILRNILVDQKIPKVFHDCRHDSLALHQFLDSCIINVFDTSASQTFKRQLQTYENVTKGEKHLLVEAKHVITQCMNVQTPGLNDVLKRYKASHGINKHKERFHRMWREGEEEIFARRPMDPDYREYCIRDVLDLPEVEKTMMGQLPQWTHQIMGWISAHYVSFGFQNSNKANKQ